MTSEPMYDMYDMHTQVTGAIGVPTVDARHVSGWCAPTEAERWQWLTEDERAAAMAEARAEADRHGHTVISVGGMVLPHPPSPAPFTDGMWPVPPASVNVDTEAFQAAMADTRERIGTIGTALAAVFGRIRDEVGPVFAHLGSVFSRITYLTPDGPPPAPVVDARTALIALNWAEWTEVVNHPDKATRRHAKAQYLKVRRHLPPAYHRRLKSVRINQFGALT
jgi:hypothetical protein